MFSLTEAAKSVVRLSADLARGALSDCVTFEESRLAQGHVLLALWELTGVDFSKVRISAAVRERDDEESDDLEFFFRDSDGKDWRSYVAETSLFIGSVYVDAIEGVEIRETIEEMGVGAICEWWIKRIGFPSDFPVALSVRSIGRRLEINVQPW